MANEPQNYQNHTLFPTPFVAVTVLCVVTIALLVVGLLLGGDMGAGLQTGATVVLAIAVAALAAKDRFGDLCLQDRIICLEMQVRLTRLGLESHFAKLSLAQLVALRFASDTELPGLVGKVIAENITAGKEIKKLVKDWQADYKRV